MGAIGPNFKFVPIDTSVCSRVLQYLRIYLLLRYLTDMVSEQPDKMDLVTYFYIKHPK